jgi:hypothetical protein
MWDVSLHAFFWGGNRAEIPHKKKLDRQAGEGRKSGDSVNPLFYLEEYILQV